MFNGIGNIIVYIFNGNQLNIKVCSHLCIHHRVSRQQSSEMYAFGIVIRHSRLSISLWCQIGAAFETEKLVHGQKKYERKLNAGLRYFAYCLEMCHFHFLLVKSLFVSLWGRLQTLPPFAFNFKVGLELADFLLSRQQRFLEPQRL